MRAKEFIPQLNELNMAPGNLMKFAMSPAASNIRAGFEAELVMPGEYDDDDQEIDMDADSTLPSNVDMGDVQEFFRLSRRDNALSVIIDDFSDYIDDQIQGLITDNLSERIEYILSDNPDIDKDDAEEQALEELTDEHYRDNSVSLLDFFHNHHLHSWWDVYERYSARLTWPHYKAVNSFSNAVSEYADSLGGLVNAEVTVADSYHGTNKQFNSSNWYMEPDSSIGVATEEDDDESPRMGVEIVSPPMPIGEMLTKFKATLNWAKQNGGRTNSTTGFHVGISMGQSTSNIDYVKLALFLGDKYVLDRFGRAANSYTKSSADLVVQGSQGLIKDQKERLKGLLAMMRAGLVEAASKAIMTANDGKYVSINMKPGYIEFRSMGDDYLNHIDVVENTILRYIRAYAVAADPQAERQSYFKKMAMLLNPSKDDNLLPFVEYAISGNENKSELVKVLTARKQAKQIKQQQDEYDDQLLRDVSTDI